MDDDDDATEIDVKKLDAGEHAVFVAHVEDRLRTDEFEYKMRVTWKALWRHRAFPPTLLIVPEGVQLTALSDADLRRAGLLRVEVH